MKKVFLIQNNPAFLFWTLGVSSYLCPENVLQVRRFHGSWPCDILAIVQEAPGEKEKLLFEKIMSALSISRFAMLEIRDESHTDWILNQLSEKNLAKRVLIFSEKLTPSIKSSLFLNTFPLKQFTLAANQSEVTARKKKLWGDLQAWLREDNFKKN